MLARIAGLDGQIDRGTRCDWPRPASEGVQASVLVGMRPPKGEGHLAFVEVWQLVRPLIPVATVDVRWALRYVS